MLSFFQPRLVHDDDRYSHSWQISPLIQHRDGVPYFYENLTHWVVKMGLRDVFSADDVNISVENNIIHINWSDYKTLTHLGRVYSSSEKHTKSLKAPIELDENSISWDFTNQLLTINVVKPKQIQAQKAELSSSSQLSQSHPNALMIIPVPDGDDSNLQMDVEGDKLCITYETTAKKKSGRGIIECSNRIQRRMTLPFGLTRADIDARVENGQLIITRHDLPASEEKPQIAENPEAENQSFPDHDGHLGDLRSCDLALDPLATTDSPIEQ